MVHDDTGPVERAAHARGGEGNGTEANGTDSPGDDANESGDGETGQPADRGAAEIVTPEERMVRLVGENGGEMRQAGIVSSLEWSESTVSRKLSKLESEGAITRFQIVRENLVFLPGNEPESLGSPWRDAVADAPQQARAREYASADVWGAMRSSRNNDVASRGTTDARPVNAKRSRSTASRDTG